jgi:hypothetical protein
MSTFRELPPEVLELLGSRPRETMTSPTNRAGRTSCRT